MISYQTTFNTKLSDRNDPVYRAALEAECGDLGVLECPPEILESECRHCLEHPRFRDPTFHPNVETPIPESKDRNDPVYRAELEAECGRLGVMEVPEGAEENTIRHCLEHPRFGDSTFHPVPARVSDQERLNAAELRGSSGADEAVNELFSKKTSACLKGSRQFGCKDGTCWRACGSSGNWAWLTAKYGVGPWLKCSIDAQCDYGIGVSSGEGCESCGCDCQ
jgi:hypothetical protein